MQSELYAAEIKMGSVSIPVNQMNNINSVKKEKQHNTKKNLRGY